MLLCSSLKDNLTVFGGHGHENMESEHYIKLPTVCILNLHLFSEIHCVLCFSFVQDTDRTPQPILMWLS